MDAVVDAVDVVVVVVVVVVVAAAVVVVAAAVVDIEVGPQSADLAALCLSGGGERSLHSLLTLLT